MDTNKSPKGVGYTMVLTLVIMGFVVPLIGHVLLALCAIITIMLIVPSIHRDICNGARKMADVINKLTKD